MEGRFKDKKEKKKKKGRPRAREGNREVFKSGIEGTFTESFDFKSNFPGLPAKKVKKKGKNVSNSETRKGKEILT